MPLESPQTIKESARQIRTSLPYVRPESAPAPEGCGPIPPRKCRMKTKGMPVFLPRIDLAGFKPLICVEEWLRKISPHRVTAEVGNVQVVPRALLGVAHERGPRVVAFLDPHAGICLEHQTVPGKSYATVWCGEAAERGALNVGVGLVMG